MKLPNPKELKLNSDAIMALVFAAIAGISAFKGSIDEHRRDDQLEDALKRIAELENKNQ